MKGMAIGVVEFSREGYKIRKFLHNNQHTQRKLLNFENWTSREPHAITLLMAEILSGKNAHAWV